MFANPQEFQLLAINVRRNILASIYQAGSGHPGVALSNADLMAYLWGRELCFDKERPYEQQNCESFLVYRMDFVQQPV